jgi:hypothetical protein
MVHSLVRTEDDNFFKQYFVLLRNVDVAKAYSLLSPEAKQSTSPEQMRTLSGYFASTTDQMEVVAGRMNTHSNDSGSTMTYDVYYEIANNDPVYTYVIAEISAQNTGDGLAVVGVHATGEKKSIKEQSRFVFAAQGMYLLLALVLPAFVAFTGYRYLTKAIKPRWQTFLFILFATLYISIADGGFTANLGFKEFMTPTGPWAPFLFSTPIPLGAIYYWIMRKRYEKPIS